MYCLVKRVKTLPNYYLEMEFETGEIKRLDFKPYLHLKCYFPLQDVDFFNTAMVVGGGVIWNDKIDIDPCFLYEEGELVIDNYFV